MGRFTDEQLARMAPGRTPAELADYDMDDGDFARKGAELLAAKAETDHALAMIKADGLNAINTLQFDPEIVAGARVLHNQNPAGPSVAELVERHMIPIRESYLEQFSSPEPVPVVKKVGANEAAFNRLIGGGRNG